MKLTRIALAQAERDEDDVRELYDTWNLNFKEIIAYAEVMARSCAYLISSGKTAKGSLTTLFMTAFELGVRAEKEAELRRMVS